MQLEGRSEYVGKSTDLRSGRGYCLRIGPTVLRIGRSISTQRRKEKPQRNLSGLFAVLLRLFSRVLLAAAVAGAGGFGFAILLAQYRFARELDLVAFAADALHQNLLTFFQLIAYVLHATIRNL